MKISARNTLPGVVRKVEEGAVNAEVTIELAPSVRRSGRDGFVGELN
jgi:molybdopterin-binding protein